MHIGHHDAFHSHVELRDRHGAPTVHGTLGARKGHTRGWRLHLLQRFHGEARAGGSELVAGEGLEALDHEVSVVELVHEAHARGM